MVEIKGITKKYGNTIAVDNLSLRIKEGEIYGLLGPNGAGKSTTINILTSLIKMNSGEVSIFNKDLRRNSNYIKRNLGIVPQEIAIYEDLTAYQNVSFFAKLYGKKGEELKRCTKEALEFVGLLDKRNALPVNFSGGMKRRLNIACAIAHNPKLLIMDEPTVGIDPQSRNHILESVKRLNEQGCTIIYTTHYMEEAETVCTKIGIIDHGKLIAEGSKEELKALVTDNIYIHITVDDCSKIDKDKIVSINGVSSVTTIEENTINIERSREVNNWEKIMNVVTSSGATIKNVESITPNLDSVFLTLTGRKIRD